MTPEKDSRVSVICYVVRRKVSRIHMMCAQPNVLRWDTHVRHDYSI